MEHVVYIGLGANLGDPCAQIEQALIEIAELPGTRLVERSSLYASAPIAETPQPDYVNAVARVSTTLSAQELLQQLLAIEAGHGRLRHYQNAPRTLDLDILLFDQSIIHQDHLNIPHPRMHQRKFVLEPLIEIDADCPIPGRGLARQWLPSLQQQIVNKLTEKHHAD